MTALSKADEAQMQARLQDAVVSCNDRCLYHSAKWAAELLHSLPTPLDDDGSETDVDSPMSETRSHSTKDAAELRIEAREAHKLLLAKTYFDCREHDRCAAVFLPSSSSSSAQGAPSSAPPSKGSARGKAKMATPTKPRPSVGVVLGLSQKALFLALYAKYIAGEKRMNEDSEMILGPQDGGVTMNKELSAISAVLEDWFANLPTSGRQPQGWLEYLYGIVLAKGKNEKQALDYFIRSVHLYSYNWGAWQELSNLLNTIDEVSLPMIVVVFSYHPPY
jgi:anaphase-promoting complex subunit 8